MAVLAGDPVVARVVPVVELHRLIERLLGAGGVGSPRPRDQRHGGADDRSAERADREPVDLVRVRREEIHARVCAHVHPSSHVGSFFPRSIYRRCRRDEPPLRGSTARSERKRTVRSERRGSMRLRGYSAAAALYLTVKVAALERCSAPPRRGPRRPRRGEDGLSRRCHASAASSKSE